MQNGDNTRLMQGNDAVVEGAIAAGVRFFGGYPITPATEILEVFARRMPEVGGVCIQMEDEIASLAAVLGASLGGTKALTATSGPGMSLMSENLGMAIMEEIPCVIVDVQRLGPATGLIGTSQGDVMYAKWGTPGGNEVIALAPCSVQEAFDLTVRAVNLSEQFRVPVFLLSDAYLGHLREKIRVPAPATLRIVNRQVPRVPPEQFYTFDAGEAGVPAMADFGNKYRSRYVSSTHDRTGKYDPPVEERQFLTHRLHNKILSRLDEITSVEELMLEDAEVAVFAYGICARSAKAAVLSARTQGIRAGLLRPITLWPFPAEAIRSAAERVARIVVAEMNLGQLVGEVERACQGRAAVGFLGEDGGQLIPPERILAELSRGC